MGTESIFLVPGLVSRVAWVTGLTVAECGDAASLLDMKGNYWETESGRDVSWQAGLTNTSPDGRPIHSATLVRI